MKKDKELIQGILEESFLKSTMHRAGHKKVPQVPMVINLSYQKGIFIGGFLSFFRREKRKQQEEN